MKRYRKALIAPLFIAAVASQPSQAHAFGFAGLFGFFSGYFVGEALSGSYETGTLNGLRR
jgi:hypothetical protein